MMKIAQCQNWVWNIA